MIKNLLKLIAFNCLFFLISCKIEQSNYTPKLYVSLEQLENIILSKQKIASVNIEGYKIGSQKNGNIIIGMNIYTDSIEDEKVLHQNALELGKLIKNNINEDINKSGIKINYYKTNTTTPFFSFESPLSLI